MGKLYAYSDRVRDAQVMAVLALRLQIFIILGQRSVLGFDVVFLDLFLPVGIHLDFWGQQGGHGDEFQVGVTDELASQPKEGLFEVIIGFGRDVVILK